MELFQQVNFELVRLYGNSFGHFTKTIEIGLRLWLEQQKDNERDNESMTEAIHSIKKRLIEIERRKEM